MYELRYYNGSKHIFNPKLEYFVQGLYNLVETKNQYKFEWLETKQVDPRIPKDKDLKFSKPKGWTLEKLTTAFYPQSAGIPFWFHLKNN